jgi:hypothetical protein
MADISFVKVDIAGLVMEYADLGGRMAPDADLGAWFRSLVAALERRDPSAHPYAMKLLGEAEAYRQAESQRKKRYKQSKESADSAESKESAEIPERHYNQPTNHLKNKSRIDPLEFREAFPKICKAFGIQTPSHRDEGEMLEAYREMKARDSTLEELAARVQRYREKCPGFMVTRNAVFKLWSNLGPEAVAPRLERVALPQDDFLPDSMKTNATGPEYDAPEEDEDD